MSDTSEVCAALLTPLNCH